MFQKVIGALTGSAMVFGLALPTQAQQATPHASNYYEVGDGAQRINLAGKLQMLSQRISSTTCHSVFGTERDLSNHMLSADIVEFDAIIRALEVGDAAYGVFGEEGSARIKLKIDDVSEEWQLLSVLAERAATGAVDDELAVLIGDQSTPLLDATIGLTGAVMDGHYNPVVMVKAETLTLDLAGRQRMLAQRMAKYVCLIDAGLNTPTAQAELEKAYELFDITLAALLTGMSSAGVIVPPTNEVVSALNDVVADWEVLSPLISRVIAGEKFDVEQDSAVFDRANAMTVNMDLAVAEYAAASVLGRLLTD